MLVEFYLCGMLPDAKPLIELLKAMMEADAATKEFENIALIRDFAKAAALDLLGIRSRNVALEGLEPMESAVEEGDQPVIPEEDRAALMTLLVPYHKAAGNRLCREHKKVRATEKRNYEMELMKGDLREDKQVAFEKMSEYYESLMKNMKSLSDVLAIDMPELPEEEEEEEEVRSSVGIKGRDGQIVFLDSPFEDEETRLFYERLPELRAVRHPELKLNIPAQVFCMSWCPDFEFRGA